MPSSDGKRFRDSMMIDYEKWHDGIGYDLESLDGLVGAERREIEGLLVPRAGNDWRDLEALARLGTPGAVSAILEVRRTGEPEIRMVAHTYGPPPTDREWDAVILEALTVVEPFSGLTVTMRCAKAHPSPAVIGALWERVRNRCGISYHAAECLCLIGGILQDDWDMSQRDLCLRLQAADSPDRRSALAELEALLSGRL
ncbi:MAG: hypothetical protein JST30_16910 [Armatimonadetes bacterium]|nr:hypothetical protein [Armatimonadota bacterium]